VKRDVSQVKSLVRALTVVEALAEYPAGVTVTQLAAGLQLPKSSVFRVLYTFAQLGYVQQDPLTERYALGTGFLRLAASVEAGSDIRQVARPFLRELRDATDEAARGGDGLHRQGRQQQHAAPGVAGRPADVHALLRAG
jgi:DNA-binding IclR family transcriptional regulator